MDSVADYSLIHPGYGVPQYVYVRVQNHVRVGFLRGSLTTVTLLCMSSLKVNYNTTECSLDKRCEI
jgi:hypothetical protein